MSSKNNKPISNKPVHYHIPVSADNFCWQCSKIKYICYECDACCECNVIKIILSEKNTDYIDEKNTDYIDEKNTDYIDEKNTDYIDEKNTDYIDEKNTDYRQSK